MAQAAGQVRRLAPSRGLVSASPAPEEQECPAAVYRDREYQTWEASSEPFEEAAAIHWVPLFYNFRGQGSCSTERRPCTYSEPLSWTSGRERQTARHPSGLALLRYTRGEDGRLLITPECGSFEEVEGQINALQDELDEIRERARRAFQVA
jgi:hypothetical protein